MDSDIVLSGRRKFLAVIPFLDTSPRRSYDMKVKSDDEFLTYEAFNEWMMVIYATPDVTNTTRMKYDNCKQREGQTIELTSYITEKLLTIWMTSRLHI
jgi:hypothetical protein